MNGFQRAGVRAINGSIQIGGRCWRWPWEPTPEPQDGESAVPIGFWTRARRGGLLLFAAWSLYRLSAQWHWIGGAIITILLICGYREGFVNEPEQQPTATGDAELLAEPEHQEQEQGPLTAEPEAEHLTPAEQFIRDRQLIVDSVHYLAAGYTNVHLADLAAHMDAADWCADLSEFRTWVHLHKVPTRDSVKARGMTRVGIRVSDLLLPPFLAEPEETPPPPLPVLPPDALQDW